MKSAKVTVKGNVQMVGFRYYTLQQARRLGVKGYVRNLPDGNVEIAASAPADRLDEFLVAVRKGPSSARVTGLDIAPADRDMVFADFSIRYR